MTELAKLYQRAEATILNAYTTEKDSVGNSQKWKVQEIAADRLAKRDSRILQSFVQAVEKLVDQLESETAKPVVVIQKSPTETVSNEKKKIAVKKAKPVKPKKNTN